MTARDIIMDNRIEIIRKQKGLTQEQLAKLLGCNQGVIQKIEKGITKLNTDWMRKIATALNCEPWELLPLDMQPKLNPKDLELIKLLKAITNSTTDTESTTTKAG